MVHNCLIEHNCSIIFQHNIQYMYMYNVLCVSARQCPSPVVTSIMITSPSDWISCGVLYDVSGVPRPVPLPLPNEYT